MVPPVATFTTGLRYPGADSIPVHISEKFIPSKWSMFPMTTASMSLGVSWASSRAIFTAS